MSIVNSIVADDAAQADGRRWVRERHTDQTGADYERVYLAEPGADVAAGLPAEASRLNQALVDWELTRNLGRIYASGPAAVVTTVHATLANIRAALREAYRTATQAEVLALGAFLSTLTDAQLATLFGVANPSAALTQLKTRLAAKATAWTAYVGAVGE